MIKKGNINLVAIVVLKVFIVIFMMSFVAGVVDGLGGPDIDGDEIHQQR